MKITSSLRPGRREAARPLRVLAVTRIFPNRLEPLACAFNLQQFRSLGRRCEIEVLAVVPYLFGASFFGDSTRVGRLSRLPRRDEIDGLTVVHPRAPYVPGGGRVLAPINAPLYLAGLLPYLPRLHGRFDVVLGAYLYPDGVAASMLARLLGLPCAIKTHGTDINVVSEWASIRLLLRSTLRSIGAAIGVSRPLVRRLIELGANPERTVLVPNGVDRTTFRPRDRRVARRTLELPEDDHVILFVGRLEKEKGIAELMRAFIALAEGRAKRGANVAHLVFVGEGTLQPEIERAALRFAGKSDLRATGARVVCVGGKKLDDVAMYVSACDVLTLPSWAEGTPNVILEALASGRPVVASHVGGVPDVVAHDHTGLLVPPRDAVALASALDAALDRTWNADALVAAAPPSWDESADELHRALTIAMSAHQEKLA